MKVKHREAGFILVMAFVCMSTAITVSEYIFGSTVSFLVSLGPCLAGWCLYFWVRQTERGE